MLKLGDKTKFNFKKGIEYTVKETLDTDFKLPWQWKICDCPNCRSSMVREEAIINLKKEGNL